MEAGVVEVVGMTEVVDGASLCVGYQDSMGTCLNQRTRAVVAR